MLEARIGVSSAQKGAAKSAVRPVRYSQFNFKFTEKAHRWMSSIREN